MSPCRPSPASEFGKPALEHPQAGCDDETSGDIEAACHDPRLDNPETLHIDLARLECQLRNGDRGGNGRVLEKRDEGAAERRESISQHDRHDDIKADLKPGQANGATSLDNALRH